MIDLGALQNMRTGVRKAAKSPNVLKDFGSCLAAKKSVGIFLPHNHNEDRVKSRTRSRIRLLSLPLLRFIDLRKDER